MNKRKMWRGGGNIPTKECITLSLSSSMFMSSFSSYVGVKAAFPLEEDERVALKKKSSVFAKLEIVSPSMCFEEFVHP